jgi:membrane fusion protein (multidrug efflux system)
LSVQGDNAFVFAVGQRGERTVAEQRPVLTGVRQDGFVELKDGVTAGEKLVADGLNKVQPGAPIRPAGARPGGKPPMAGAGGARPAA